MTLATVWHGQARWVGLGLFLLGIIGVIIALNVPVTAAALRDLGRSGYFGSVVAGAMYAISLTSATATVVFANIPENYNPLLVAMLGGFGAMAYDMVVFSFTRRDGFRGKIGVMLERFHHHPKLPRWLSLTIGAVLIASPLPDELGSAFFGLSNARWPDFMWLSFGLNTLGILVITGLF